MKKILLTLLMLISIVCLTACNTAVTYTVDDLTFTLTEEWTYDEDCLAFSNSENEWANYMICETWDDNVCTSAAERKATFASDGSDGFDISDITVNGTEALLVHEPVNEIDDYYVFFYANGTEHFINYETPFGDDVLVDITAEFLDSISW